MMLSHALITRLRFIDFLLDQYGHVNRSAIVDYFGLSTPQASLDMQAYMAHAPGNMKFDRTLRQYQRTAAFVRVWP